MDIEKRRKARWQAQQARHAARRAQVVELALTMTQAQVGRELGLSRQRVNAILKPKPQVDRTTPQA